RRAEDQHVVERLTASAGGFDVDLHLLADRLLAKVFVQPLGPDRSLDRVVFARRVGGNDALVVHRPIVAWVRPENAWRGPRSDLDLRTQFDQPVARDPEEPG